MTRALGLCQGNAIRIVYPELHAMRAPWTRAVGLIGRKHVREDSAYMFRYCPSVHTYFMRTAIDVIVCDKHMNVLAVETMQPWRASSPKAKGAHTIIEAAAGSAAKLGIAHSSSLCEIKGRD